MTQVPHAVDRSRPARQGQPRVLVLGGHGMLGHKLWEAAQRSPGAFVTVRGSSVRLPGVDPGDPRVITGVDAERFETVEAALAAASPDVVINAIGLVKQRAEAADPVSAIRVNALFPHLLARASAAAGARLIHISTDCVFSGRTGAYRESDAPDAADLYGRSKALGEQWSAPALTLRTSMIGRELAGAAGLLEWFLSRRNRDAAGYPRAIFSGLTTAVLAGVVFDLIDRHPRLTGLYHVGGDPIDKARLLGLLNAAYGANVDIVPSDEVVIDRSLNVSAFREATGFIAPSWESMVADLAADPAPYEEWRAEHAPVDARR